MIQYQILQTNITRTVWWTVRRVTNKILELQGKETLCSGQLTSSTHLIKPNYLVILTPLTQQHCFLPLFFKKNIEQMSFSASKVEYVLYVFPDSLGTETLEDIKGNISKSSFDMIGITLYQVVFVIFSSSEIRL